MNRRNDDSYIDDVIDAYRAANRDDRVRYFTADDAPLQPYSDERKAGWYWRDATGEWAGPAPSGNRLEAVHNAKSEGAIR